MNFGAHLPLISFEDGNYSLDTLLEYTRTAEALGYSTLAANDHLVFQRPWIDGPTALAAVLSATQSMDLATTVSLPVVRGPVALAKSLAAIDVLSGGRLWAGIGPGSSARDYAAVGVPFEERWKRVDESAQVLRALWRHDSEPFVGSFYSTEGMALEPRPTRPGGIPIWIGSWGSEAGLRRVVRLADGWLASGYNTNPPQFQEAWASVKQGLAAAGRDADSFPNAISTMWCCVTEDKAERERILEQVVARMLNRPVEKLRGLLPIGTAEQCADIFNAYQAAGAQLTFIWPLRDPVRQLNLFMERVAPLVTARP